MRRGLVEPADVFAMLFGDTVCIAISNGVLEATQERLGRRAEAKVLESLSL